MAIYKVNINNPVYLKISNSTLADCDLTISIYSGTFQSSPSTTYQLRKNEVANNNFVIFEIGELIKDYIEYSFNGTFGNNGVNLWVKTVATPRNSAGTNLDAITTLMMAFDGVGYLYTTKYQLVGEPSCEPFYERFENQLAGWACTMDIIIENDVSSC